MGAQVVRFRFLSPNFLPFCAITTLLSFFFDKLWLVRFYVEICCMESEAKFLYFKSCTVKNCKIKGKNIDWRCLLNSKIRYHHMVHTSKKLSEKWSKKSKAVETKLSGLNLQISNYWKCRWLGLICLNVQIVLIPIPPGLLKL